jgi:hypothetical protein
MHIQLTEVGVTAGLTVNVPRDAAGNLEAGVTKVLRRVDELDAIEDLDVTGLTPRLNDLQAEVTAELTLALDRTEDEAARAALDEAFGVTVERLAAEQPPP